MHFSGSIKYLKHLKPTAPHILSRQKYTVYLAITSLGPALSCMVYISGSQTISCQGPPELFVFSPGVGKVVDGEGHYSSTLAPEGPRAYY